MKQGGLARRFEAITERFFFRRLDRLVPVRRFVITWVALLLLLCGCVIGQIQALSSKFQSLQPISGGVYTEGILGDFTNANPLYATSQVDESVSKLLFAGLFKYDDQNKLVGDLASSYDVDASGKVYTVHLKPRLTWQDGAPLTADDVAFTYKMIQNPDALSVLNQSWQGIQVASVNPLTVTFTLPSVLGSFPFNMTNGIIPQHILQSVSPNELRSTSFNTAKPIGAGPFRWQTIEVSGDSPDNRQAQIALNPFAGYNGGQPKLASFVIHAFHAESELQKSFQSQQVTGASLTDPSADVLAANGVLRHDFVVSAADMVFFKESSPVLSEAAVRKALVQSVNIPAIIDNLDYVTRPVRGPFLLGQSGYDKTLEQPVFDSAAATTVLDAAGWKLDDSGFRVKNGVALRFNLYAQDLPESRQVTKELQTAWRSVGVRATVTLQSGEDLQRTISSRQYDALLYGISIGVDPDVFVYWHSSQTDVRSSGLNFSEFKNKQADLALEAGRTRIEPDLRAIKYKPFLQAWQQDTPALGLYQPRYQYLTHGQVFGLDEHVLNTNTDRYTNVQNWMVRQAAATERP